MCIGIEKRDTSWGSRCGVRKDFSGGGPLPSCLKGGQHALQAGETETKVQGRETA